VFFVGAVVQVLALSRFNATGRAGMIEVLASAFHNQALPFVAPFLAATGSFVAGSATLSNLLLAPIVARLATELALSVPLVLALQLVGAAAGNMIALPNCAAVQAAVGDQTPAHRMLGELVPYCAAYLAIAGAAGLWLARIAPH
jgi:lactate permease